jgi:hypothetical protein
VARGYGSLAFVRQTEKSGGFMSRLGRVRQLFRTAADEAQRQEDHRRRLRSAPYLIADEVFELSGAMNRGYGGFESTPASEITVSPDPGAPELMQNRIMYVPERDLQVLGELTGNTGPKWGEEELGASIDEQRDALYRFVSTVAERAETSLGADLSGEEVRQPVREFHDAVSQIWVKENLGRLTNRLEAKGIVDARTANELLDRPAVRELTPNEEVVKGFLDDMRAKSGRDSAKFLAEVQTTPMKHKAWQIAGALMSNRDSPLRDLPMDPSIEARRRLTTAIEEQLPSLQWPAGQEQREVGDSPASVSGRATERVLSALAELEKEMAPAPLQPQLAQAQIFDYRQGTAAPGSTSRAQVSGDGAGPAAHSTGSKRDQGPRGL